MELVAPAAAICMDGAVYRRELLLIRTRLVSDFVPPAPATIRTIIPADRPETLAAISRLLLRLILLIPGLELAVAISTVVVAS